MDPVLMTIFIVAFIISVIFHEVAHGWVANYYGDDTARISGRLSLNPLVHIDPIGSILVPFMLIISSAGFIFGWAKPVPVNPYRLSGGAKAYRLVTLAGVATNLFLAIAAALVLKAAIQFFGLGTDNLGILFFSALMQVNIILAVFNILPLPGFDGWNFLTTIGPIARLISQTPLGNPLFIAQYGLFISILLLFLLLPLISVLFSFVFGLFIIIFGL
ncbi:site-2 protease family protein [Candidatus Falkowbacteria bacterium]|nr:site-2 protease family protein [Candidatus Falkowbacteria bacterium]